jgi:integrase
MKVVVTDGNQVRGSRLQVSKYVLAEHPRVTGEGRIAAWFCCQPDVVRAASVRAQPATNLERHILDWQAQPNEYLLPRRHTIPRWDTQERKNNKLPPDRIDRIEYRDQPMRVHGLHKWWYRCLEQAGVVASGQTSGERMHKARHTAGQRVLDHTHGNLKAVQKLLGHSSISTTGDIYTDWDIDQLAETLRGMYEDAET